MTASTPLFIRAAQHQVVERTPLWIMRQAGRYLPEYQALRKKVDFLQLCKTPELACEASLMPLRRFALDAAIIFSDIMIPIEAMGCKVEFTDKGPTISTPIRTAQQIQALRIAEPLEAMPFVMQGISLLKQAVGDRLPVIGFAGAPFTLAAYMVEGKPSNSFAKVREFLYAEPELYDQLARKLAATVAKHLQAQIQAGASVVQIFDTWAGLLSESEYRRFALPYTKLALQPLLKQGSPTIHFIHGGQHLLQPMSEAGSAVLSLDWRVDMATAKATYGERFALQGNLNPTMLFTQDGNELTQATQAIVNLFALPQSSGFCGHIFNLGHGIHPQTPIENVERMIDAVHACGNNGGKKLTPPLAGVQP